MWCIKKIFNFSSPISLSKSILTLAGLKPAFADCKESGSSYHGSFCGDGQICGSHYHDSWTEFLGSVASATIVASVHWCLFVVGGVTFLWDISFVFKQNVHKMCTSQENPFRVICVTLHKTQLAGITYTMSEPVTLGVTNYPINPVPWATHNFVKLVSFIIILQMEEVVFGRAGVLSGT